MLWTAIFIALLGVYFLSITLNLLRNIKLAQATGLLYFIFPFFEFSVLYLGLLETRTFSYILTNRIPRSPADYFYVSGFKYRWTAKDRICRKHGKVYLMFTPWGLSCHVSDAAVVSQICRARQSFPRSTQNYSRFSA